VAINERSDALRAEGRDIIKLGLGQSPFPVPAPVVAALQAHAGEKDYLPVKGLRSLRDAVAAFHARRDGIEGRTGADVVIGPGSKELLFLLQLVYDGDLVIPRPAWVSYAPQAQLLGRPCHQVPTDSQDGWRLSPESLDALCTEQGPRPRILVLNYPCNPTGMTLDEARLRGIAEVARRHEMVVVSDEIYGEIHHQGGHISIARYYPEGTILSAGLSKWCGAGGWRLGTFLFPPGLDWLRDAVAVAASETYTSVSAPIQHAAVTAYQESAEIAQYLDRSRRVLGALGRWCAARLRAAGAHCPDPEGGFYLLPDFSSLRTGLMARGVTDAASLCAGLLEATGVAVLPGSNFGQPATELTLRLAYVDFDGAAALHAAAPDAALDSAWLAAHCPRVVEGIEKMSKWVQP
jgi:aspartate aminotransferase